MSSKLERGFKVLELLAVSPDGCPLSTVSDRVGMPLSATHRLLAELCECGYVRQTREQGDYMLTVKLVSLGLSFLSASGVVDVAQPLLDRLAQESGELVRLAVVDGDQLIFVAKAQGATRGLRYDPDMGLSVPLSCSAAGHALLSTMSDEVALERVARQGLGKPEEYGPRAPVSVKALLTYVRAARKQGFSAIVDVFAPGMASIGAPVHGQRGEAIGVVTIAGPVVRLTAERMVALAPALLQTARDVSAASSASPIFRNRERAAAGGAPTAAVAPR